MKSPTDIVMQEYPDSYPEAFLKRMYFWSPPVPIFQPQKEKPNSSLRMAGIVSQRLLEGLRHEGELFLLTPDNWQETLQYGGVDILIIESCGETATGNWYLSQITNNEQHEPLIRLIQLARKLSVPTVFWNTKDHLYHSHYVDFSQLFDYVFCADPLQVE
ncbi:hypothetical protein ACFL3I_01540, partial [Pseudomonadota bacterium]